MRVNRLKLNPDKPDRMLEGKSDALVRKGTLTMLGFSLSINSS